MHIIIAVAIIFAIVKIVQKQKLKKLEAAVLKELGFENWHIVPYFDEHITVKGDQLSKYNNGVDFLKEKRDMIEKAEKHLNNKADKAAVLRRFIADNKYKSNLQYKHIMGHFPEILKNADACRIKISYTSSKGNNLGTKEITVNQSDIDWIRLEDDILDKMGIPDWNDIPYFDEHIIVKSRQALENYSEVRFFKENKEKLEIAGKTITRKISLAKKMKGLISDDEYKSNSQYPGLIKHATKVFENAEAYRIRVDYISSAGNNLGTKDIAVNQEDINRFSSDISLLMDKGEYNKYIKEQQKEALNLKHREYYALVNNIIDCANKNREVLVIKEGKNQLDSLIALLFDRTVNSIKKIKNIDSDEWDITKDFIDRIKNDVEKIVGTNQKILEYYESDAFSKIKETCEVLMSTQREFNEYITEKVESISKLFGTRVVRNETANEDEYAYIRPYKKTITPFTAEVSATVFASAENSPLEYIVKNFYPNKTAYPEQIHKLYQLVEELETLREAKLIIENYKKEYQQYLGGVPDYIWENDEAGFYSRLGFANIDESVLAVEYKFSYTSGGGMAQRSFTVPMTEETIVELINVLESKLTAEAFAKEQRTLMTKKLREFIKNRDNHTCCNCGNSTHAEPNLLLEIDHIIPVAKGGCTTENNLQTLCWKCNRSKGAKLAD